MTTLEHLLGLDATDLADALDQAAMHLVQALHADKIDVFLYDPAIATLVAVGISSTAMGRHQVALGLDRLPVANGGRAVQVYLSGSPHLTGHADQDPEELPGVVGALGVRSTISTPVEVAHTRRGVLQAASARPDAFSERDLTFVVAVARWLGLVAHRAEVAQLERGRFALARVSVDVLDLVRETASRLGGRLIPIRVQSDPDLRELRAEIDPDRVRQALENLLSNALRHAPTGTAVTVHVATEEREGEEGEAWVVVTVRDRGPGIDPAVAPHLFERYAAGVGSTGLGLGLYIAHQIALAHGGTLSATSWRGRGAAFELALPCHLEPRHLEPH